MHAVAALAWFGGGALFGGSTLNLRRFAPVFLSLLGGAFRSRFLFLADAPVPAFMCLPTPTLTRRVALGLAAGRIGHVARGAPRADPESRLRWLRVCGVPGSLFGA